MILGHLTATYALSVPLKRRYPVLGNIGPLVFGAYLPDLLDKPLHYLIGTPSRGPAHSAVLLALVFYLLIRAMPGRRRLLIPLAAGAFLHLAQDLASPATLFWPLFGSWDYYEDMGLYEKLQSYYLLFGSPGEFLLEMASYPFFIYFLLRRKPAAGMKCEASDVETA
jgi:hypothetical protein